MRAGQWREKYVEYHKRRTKAQKNCLQLRGRPLKGSLELGKNEFILRGRFPLTVPAKPARAGQLKQRNTFEEIQGNERNDSCRQGGHPVHARKIFHIDGSDAIDNRHSHKDRDGTVPDEMVISAL